MTHEAEVSRRTGVTSPIKTGKKQHNTSIRDFFDLAIPTHSQLFSLAYQHSTATGRIENARVQNEAVQRASTRTDRVHVPIRCRGQCDSLAPHRLREHLRRQYPPDGSIADPIRCRKQVHASEKRHCLQSKILKVANRMTGSHPD